MFLTEFKLFTGDEMVYLATYLRMNGRANKPLEEKSHTFSMLIRKCDLMMLVGVTRKRSSLAKYH